MIRIGILLSVLAQCYGDGGIAYRGPPPVREVFHNGQSTYFLHSDKVGWDEANAICRSNNGHLAEPENAYDAQFLAQCIADAWASFEDMWIGGQKIQNEWQWVSKQKKITEVTRQQANTTFLYPPWVAGSLPLRMNRDCLGIDRNGHSDPFFVDLDCKLTRPFICEIPHDNEVNEPVKARAITIFDMEFMLFHGRLSWDGAVAYCRSNGYVLASVRNSSIAEKLAKAMLKSRPEFEDVWVGGAYRNGKWMWVDSAEEISDTPIQPSDGGVAFPPWMHETGASGKGKNCILFDRHLCDHPTFINIMCNRVRDFVCAKVIEEEEVKVEIPTIQTFRKREYRIHHSPANFEEGLIICQNEQNTRGKGRMLFIDGGILEDPYDELTFLMQMMADNKDSIIHVWLAAQYNAEEKVYKWLYDSPNFEKNRTDNRKELSNEPNSATGYPPWCHNDEATTDAACLNLDRQNYNTPLFYGLECNATQTLICVLEAAPKGVERFTIGNYSYQSSENYLTMEAVSWRQAKRTCMEDTGHMLSDLSLEEIKQIASQLSDGDYYINAKYNDHGELKWDTSGVTIDFPGIPAVTATSGQCVYMTVAEKALGKFNLQGCDAIENVGFVCSDKCGSLINEVDDHSFHCTWRNGKGVTEGYLGKMCEKRCATNEVVVGAKKITCTASGWHGHRAAQGGTCASQQDAANQLKSVLDTLVTEGASNGLLFIYDGSVDVRPDETEFMRYFFSSLLTYMPAKRARRDLRQWRTKRDNNKDNEGIEIPVISLGSQGIQNVKEDNICSALGNFSQLDLSNTTGRRDYNRAFYIARRKLEDTYNPYTVVLISLGPNQGDEYRESLKSLKTYAKTIITVGVGSRYNNDELAEMATVDSKKNLFMVGMQDESTLKQLADNILKTENCAAQIAELKKKVDEAVQQAENIRELGALSDRKIKRKLIPNEQQQQQQQQPNELGKGQRKAEETPTTAPSSTITDGRRLAETPPASAKTEEPKKEASTAATTAAAAETTTVAAAETTAAAAAETTTAAAAETTTAAAAEETTTAAAAAETTAAPASEAPAASEETQKPEGGDAASTEAPAA